MSMDKWLCAVIGEEYSEFKNYHIDTKKRTRALAVLIHIPVLIWAGIGFQVASENFMASLPSSIMSAFLFGLVIYAIEYAIIQIKNTGWKENWKQTLFLGGMRFGLAILMAGLGSFIVDTKLFDKDISVQLSFDRKAAESSAFDTRSKALYLISKNENKLMANLEELTTKANNERYGKGVSGRSGYGPSTKNIEQDRDTAASQLADFKLQKIQNLVVIESNYKKSVEDAKKISDNPGLLIKATALHEFIAKNIMAWYLFWAFFIAMGILELLVLVVKLFSGRTVDDEINEFKATLLREEANTRKVIRSKKLQVVENTYDPRLERAKAVLSGIN